MLVIFLNVILAILLAVISYFIADFLFSGKNGKIKKMLVYFNDKYEKRYFDSKSDQVYKNKKKHENLNKLDRLIYNSNIRKYFKYMTSELYIFFNIVFSLLLFVTLFKTYRSIVFATIGFIAVPVILITILKFMASINFDKIDNNIMPFVDALKSNARIKNNLLYIMENSTHSLKEPLRTYNADFVNDIKRGVSTEKAFNTYENKIENVRMKIILKNLYVCSINNANYNKLLNRTRIVLQKYYEEKEKRRSAVLTGQVGIAFIVAVSFFILFSLIGINTNLFTTLRTNFVGQLLSGYFICSIIFSVCVCIYLRKFNY